MDFDRLIAELTLGSFGNFGLLDLVVSLVFPSVLCTGVVFIYRKVQMHNSYSPSFLLALYMLAALSGGVTLFIGDNIARAFGLIGAMSIIRFRNALKEPIDAVFVLWTLAIGMSSGAGYYLAAACLTVVTSLITLGVKFLGLAEFGTPRSFLKVMIAEDPQESSDAKTAISQVENHLKHTTRDYKLLHELHAPDQNTKTRIYSLLPRSSATLEDITSDLKGIRGVKIGQALYRPSQRIVE